MNFNTAESMGAPERSGQNAVELQHHKEFLQAFSSKEALREENPAMVHEKQKLERDITKLQSATRQFDLKSKIERDGGRDRLTQQYLNVLTRDMEDLNDTKKNRSLLAYGRSVIGGVRRVYTPERVQSLRQEFYAAEGELAEAQLKPMRDIVQSGALESLEIPDDPHAFAEQMKGHRYFTFMEESKQIVRIDGRAVARDLEHFKGRVLTPVEKKFKNFLESLLEADLAQKITHLDIPKLRDQQETNPRVEDAKGALRMLAFVTLVTLGVVSMIMERDKDFPVVGALYLGLAGLVYNPDMLNNNPTDRLRRDLAFTVPQGGKPDKWRQLMTGPYAGSLAGQNGVELFEWLLEDQVQQAIEKLPYNEENPQEYFTTLEENGVPAEHIRTLRTMHRDRPDLFDFLVRNTAGVHTTDSQRVLLQFVENGTTGEKIAHKTAKSVKNAKKKRSPKTQLGGLGGLTSS